MHDTFQFTDIERFDELDSTNRLAADRIRAALNSGNLPPAGLVIVANRQTAGRGQHGRTWQSPEGGLYLSAVVTSIPSQFRDRLALVAGVTAAIALQKFTTASIQLRWPNDLLLNHKKIGGILCESIIQGDHFAAIIGLGLNINTDIRLLPAPLQLTATSLFAHDQKQHDPQKILSELLTGLTATLNLLLREGLSPIIAQARTLDSLYGQQIEFQHGSDLITGTAAGISDSGELLIHSSPPPAPPTPYMTGSILSLNGQPLRP